MKSKAGKIILSVTTFILSCVSAFIGWQFMDTLSVPFWMRLVCGFCFNMPPLLIITIITTIFRKDDDVD